MRPQVPLLALLTALLLGAAALAGCGDDGDDRTAQQVLEATFASENASISGGRLMLSAELEGVEGVERIELSGPFETSEGDGLPRFDLTLSVTGSGTTFEAGAISTDDAGFLVFQGTTYAVPDDLFQQFVSGYEQQRSQAESESGDQPSLQALGIEPLNWLENPEKAGETEVGGVETVHVTAGVDVPKLLADLQRTAERADQATGGQLSTEDAEQLGDDVRSAQVDVYAGKEDDRLRRMVVDLELRSASVVLTLELTQLDEPQDIAPPEETRPLQDLLSLIGAATGQGGVGASGGNQEYLECIQEAGQDLERAQECADLL